MLYRNYDWSDSQKKTTETEIAYTGDSNLNRSMGIEVLHLINDIMGEWGLKKKISGQKLEKIIRMNLPFNITNIMEIKKWIKVNWKEFS